MRFIRNHKKLIITFSIFILFSIVTFSINYVRLSKNQPPVLVIKGNTIRDGGTTYYYGLGYKVTDWNEIRRDGKKGYEITTLFYSKYFD